MFDVGLNLQGVRIVIVEAGTVVENRATGEAAMVTDTAAVSYGGALYVTQTTATAMARSTMPAPAPPPPPRPSRVYRRRQHR